MTELQSLIHEIAAMYTQENARFEEDLEHSLTIMDFFPALPQNEMRNAHLDLSQAIRALSEGNLEQARLWAERGRRHVVLAVHDNLRMLIEFESRFVQSLMDDSAVQQSVKYRILNREVEDTLHFRREIAAPSPVPRATVEEIRQDIVDTRAINVQLKYVTERLEILFFDLGNVLGGPEVVRDRMANFRQIWMRS